MFSTKDARDPIDLYKLYAAKRPLGYSTSQKEPLFYMTPAAIKFLKQKVGEKRENLLQKLILQAKTYKPKVKKTPCSETP